MKKAKQANNATHTPHAAHAAPVQTAAPAHRAQDANNQSSPIAWLLRQTGRYKGQYVWSVVLALLGVACSVAPYFVVAQIVYALMIIFLDEATANIDPENENELMHAFRQLTAEKTVIMIAHHLKTVQHADQILVVDHGRIVQQGTHAELMQQDGLYRGLISERNEAVNWAINK